MRPIPQQKDYNIGTSSPAGAVAKSARLGTPHENHCKSCHPGRLFLLGHVLLPAHRWLRVLTAISTRNITLRFASRITSTINRSGIFLFMDPPISAIQLAILSMGFVVPPVSFFGTAYAERLAGNRNRRCAPALKECGEHRKAAGAIGEGLMLDCRTLCHADIGKPILEKADRLMLIAGCQWPRTRSIGHLPLD